MNSCDTAADQSGRGWIGGFYFCGWVWMGNLRSFYVWNYVIPEAFASCANKSDKLDLKLSVDFKRATKACSSRNRRRRKYPRKNSILKRRRRRTEQKKIAQLISQFTTPGFSIIIFFIWHFTFSFFFVFCWLRGQVSSVVVVALEPGFHALLCSCN